MYEISGRVGYSETDPGGVMTLKSVAERFQDVSYFELADRGFDRDYFAARNVGWFIFFWQIDVLAAPRINERIAVGTFPYRTGGLSECRNYYVRDCDGNDLVLANSVWSLVDLGRMQIVKLPDEIKERDTVKGRLEMDYLGRRIVFPPDLSFEEIGRCAVAPWQLDSNRHLNNSRYIEMALANSDLNTERIRRICVEYQSQAPEGATLRFLSAREGENRYVVCASDSGKSFCRMKIETAE